MVRRRYHNLYEMLKLQLALLVQFFSEKDLNQRKRRGMKQVIVLRKDLNMRKGKMVAQGSHACLYAYLETPEAQRVAWFGQQQTKICVGVDSEAELVEVYNQAKAAGLPCVLIRDAGLTEFKEPTLTAVGIGPADNDKIDKITGKKKLL